MGSLGARSESVPSEQDVTEDANGGGDAVVIDLRAAAATVELPTSMTASGDALAPPVLSPVEAVVPHSSVWVGRAYRAAKRTLDVLAAVLGIALLSPFFLAIAVAIKLDDGGPVHFLQERVGQGGKRFRIVKFRTMEPDSDESVHREHTARLSEAPGSLHIADDPRITRVGDHLRRWSLDETPNLLNVLTGQMSLVGPRPLVPYEVAYLSAQQRRRLEVKPGITGLAQINGRLWLRPDDRTSLDIDYVENRSFWLDVVVLVKTIPALWQMRG